jgi:hypothetical protein
MRVDARKSSGVVNVGGEKFHQVNKVTQKRYYEKENKRSYYMLMLVKLLQNETFLYRMASPSCRLR